MLPRFFSETSISPPIVVLDDEEAHHLIHVLRFGKGDQITLFDGAGGEFLGTIEQVGRREVQVCVGERQPVERENRIRVSLAVSLPKGDRQKMLVEKLTELGAFQLIPLLTTRGVAQPTENACQRLQRHVIAACKQCGRNRLMEIGQPQGISDLLSQVDSNFTEIWIAHPEYAANITAAKPEEIDVGRVRTNATPATDATDVNQSTDGTYKTDKPVSYLTDGSNEPTSAMDSARSVLVLIGPEGGFTDQEYLQATTQEFQRLGFKRLEVQRLDLGPRILRVETAAIAALCRWAH